MALDVGGQVLTFNTGIVEVTSNVSNMIDGTTEKGRDKKGKEEQLNTQKTHWYLLAKKVVQ